MDIKKLSKICDMAPEEQTQDVKTQLYNLTQQFVRKYWRQYYPQYKGEIDDLTSDFYLEFETPKGSEARQAKKNPGKEFKKETLLDKFDPNITTLPYLVKSAVIRKLIDRSRTDKGELNYSENYDEETGDLSLDYLANAESMDESEIALNDIEFDRDQIREAKRIIQSMDQKQRKELNWRYSRLKKTLPENMKEFFETVLSDSFQVSDSVVPGISCKNLVSQLRRVKDSAFTVPVKGLFKLMLKDSGYVYQGGYGFIEFYERNKKSVDENISKIRKQLSEKINSIEAFPAACKQFESEYRALYPDVIFENVPEGFVAQFLKSRLG